MPVRVVLANPFALVRAALRTLIEEEPDIEVVGTASGGRKALRLVEELAPDLLLLEPLVRSPSGLDVVRQLEASGASVRVLALSRCRQAWMARLLLKEGVYGYLLKKESPAMLFEALRGAARGEDGWLSHEIASKLYSRSHLGLVEARRRLTRREWEVLQLVVEGHANRQIAEQLFIRVSTTKTHVHQILEKLDMPSRTKLMAWAYRLGLFELPPPPRVNT